MVGSAHGMGAVEHHRADPAGAPGLWRAEEALYARSQGAGLKKISRTTIMGWKESVPPDRETCREAARKFAGEHNTAGKGKISNERELQH